MNLVLEPNRGANPFWFGRARAEIRASLASLRLVTPEPENDFYPELGLFLGYDGREQLEFLEVTSPSSATYQDFDFASAKVDDIADRLSQLGFVRRDRAGSITFSPINLALFPSTGTVRSVSIFREGYYEQASS